MKKFLLGVIIILALFTAVKLVWSSPEETTPTDQYESKESFNLFDHEAHH